MIVKERWVLGAQSENSSEKSYANFPVSPKLKFNLNDVERPTEYRKLPTSSRGDPQWPEKLVLKTRKIMAPK